MTPVAAPRRTVAELAGAAAAALAVDPRGAGGVRLHGPAGPPRDAWLNALRVMLPPDTPFLRLPASVTLDRLLGGLDLTATLASGRPTFERGLLSRADGGMVCVLMAERLSTALAGPIAACVDTGMAEVERDGFTDRSPAGFGLILLDEGEPDEAPPPSALLERVGLHLDLATLAGAVDFSTASAAEVLAARRRLADVEVRDADRNAMVATAAQLGVASIRAPLAALRVARCFAALDSRTQLNDDDLALAAALVIVPRATRWPEPEPESGEEAPPPEPQPDSDDDPSPGELGDRVVETVRAMVPPGLLELAKDAALRSRVEHRHRSGAEVKSQRHGRPSGNKAGDPRRARVDLLATLRAAAPWQRVRQGGGPGARLVIRRDDLRVRRLVSKVGTTVIFVVDASGSSALQRLGEAKGAVETLLAESYVRRDRVALISFRGTRAEVVVPPTRSLTRARRLLASVVGGGGTPLAAAIEVARELAVTVRRGGGTPLIVFLTDARANVRRDGTGGRPDAEREAAEAARTVAVEQLGAILIDTSPRPSPFARQLAALMDGTYQPLPVADASRVASVVRQAVEG